MAFNKTKALEEAAKLVSQRKITQAIKQYLAVAAKDPQDLPLLNTIGDLCVRDGNTTEALQQFRRLADAYTREGFTLKAIAIFKKIAKLDPHSVDPLIHLAELYAAQKLTHESEQQYAQALALCERQGLKEQAGEILAKLVAADPANAPRRQRLAGICERTGMDKVAPQLLEALGKAFVAVGEWAKAEDVFELLTRRGDSRAEWQSLLRQCREHGPNANDADQPTAETPTGAAPQPGELEAGSENPSVEVDVDRAWETFASSPPGVDQEPDATSASAERPRIEGPAGATAGNSSLAPSAEPNEPADGRHAEAAGAETSEIHADQPSGWAPATSLIDKLTKDLELAMAAESPSSGAGEGLQSSAIDPAELLAEDDEHATAEDAPRIHFNLGLAFREIGLLDDAIAELQKSSKGPANAEEPWKFEALLLLGVCFMEKGMPNLAAPWLARALESPGLDEDTSMALTYDLATAYERAGNRDGALEKFAQVYGVNAGYRDVAEKIRTLQSKQV